MKILMNTTLIFCAKKNLKYLVLRLFPLNQRKNVIIMFGGT